MAINIQVGVNSWVTLTEALEYLESRIDSTDWLSLSSNLQKQYIISTFRWIYFSGKYNISKTSTDEKVKNAQIEGALWMYNYYSEYEKRQSAQAGGVNEFTLSKWTEKYSGNTSFPPIINDLLEDFITSDNYFPKINRAND